MFEKAEKSQEILHLSNEKQFYHLQSQLYLNNKHISVPDHSVDTMIQKYCKVRHLCSYVYTSEDLAYMGNSLSIYHVFFFCFIVCLVIIFEQCFEFAVWIIKYLFWRGNCCLYFIGRYFFQIVASFIFQIYIHFHTSSFFIGDFWTIHRLLRLILFLFYRWSKWFLPILSTNKAYYLFF